MLAQYRGQKSILKTSVEARPVESSTAAEQRLGVAQNWEFHKLRRRWSSFGFRNSPPISTNQGTYLERPHAKAKDRCQKNIADADNGTPSGMTGSRVL